MHLTVGTGVDTPKACATVCNFATSLSFFTSSITAFVRASNSGAKGGHATGIIGPEPWHGGSGCSTVGRTGRDTDGGGGCGGAGPAAGGGGVAAGVVTTLPGVKTRPPPDVFCTVGGIIVVAIGVAAPDAALSGDGPTPASAARGGRGTIGLLACGASGPIIFSEARISFSPTFKLQVSRSYRCTSTRPCSS